MVVVSGIPTSGPYPINHKQPMTSGTLKADPAFSPGIDAEFVGTGNDYIHADPDGRHLRLNAHGVVKYASVPA